MIDNHSNNFFIKINNSKIIYLNKKIEIVESLNSSVKITHLVLATITISDNVRYGWGMD